MPYIPKEDRKIYDDDVIKDLISSLLHEDVNIDGHLNYIFTKILKSVYKLKYFNYNRAIGLLECIKQEYYRIVLSQYEEKKRQEAGDI